ncbi:MAG: putative DNA-binding domain-containing protein [Deltaproteobacteria bacterium]|nr:putative DNA-binding domain-containing protein [Deltaproteobacteria bacterium]
MLSLRELQTSFFHSIASVPGGGSGNFAPKLVQVVEGRGQLGPEERINIYAQMYCARLVEVLREDFPRVAAVLGCERFERVVRTYLARHPSTHPSLRYLGRHFAAFLETWSEVVSLPFLSDLARLEWAREEVFDALDAESLRIEHLHAFSPDEWPGLRFQLIPAFQLLQSEWPVPEIWAAAAEETPTERGWERREKTAVRIWREGFAVYHSRMDATEQAALAAVRAGEPFAGICAALESLVPTEEAAPVMGSLLLRWLEDGILSADKT